MPVSKLFTGPSVFKLSEKELDILKKKTGGHKTRNRTRNKLKTRKRKYVVQPPKK
jgi:hypothetical protein